MSTPDQAPDLDTPTTSSEATPGSERSLHSTIHIVRSEEDHDGLVQQPPKLTLKLRTLAEKPAPSPTDVQTDLPDPDNGALIGVRHGDQISQEKLTKHLRWLVATPASSIPAKATGSMKNPIDVDTLKTPSPHKFVNRPVGYFAPIPLQYRPSRPNLASQLTTPNGAAIISGKVGGHESHDIYKAFIARRKVTTPPGFAQLATQLKSQIGRPSAPRPTVHVYRPNVVSPQCAYPYQPFPATYRTPINGYPIFTKQNEEELRQRALQYIRDDSRPRPRKRRIPDDPDETSGSENEDTPGDATTRNPHTPKRRKTSSTISTPSTGASEDVIFDRNLRITELVEHTQLVSAMLMSYPYSNDHEGLREDVSMLMAASNKKMQTWLAGEVAWDADTEERRRFSTAVTTPSPDLNRAERPQATHAYKNSGASPIAVPTQEMMEVEQTKREEEMRKYLSTDSDFWKKLEGPDPVTATIAHSSPAPLESAADQIRKLSSSANIYTKAQSMPPPPPPPPRRADAAPKRLLRPLLPKPIPSVAFLYPVGKEMVRTLERNRSEP